MLEKVPAADIGPLQAFVDELDFNLAVCKRATSNPPFPTRFRTTQFDRLIAEGLLSLLADELRDSLLSGYTGLIAANDSFDMFVHQDLTAAPGIPHMINPSAGNCERSLLDARKRVLAFLTNA